MPRATLLRWSVLASLLTVSCGGPAPASTRDEGHLFDLDATRQLIAQQNERYTDALLRCRIWCAVAWKASRLNDSLGFSTVWIAMSRFVRSLVLDLAVQVEFESP